ncbi:hypothetical protein ABT127_18080 [Streptomyces sp. NPDC001904]|uniref:hypothetical protein n=1 Tax=Streptomyces sp. NPDC001904 TaxID=3154531 RepID=UPI003323C217
MTTKTDAQRDAEIREEDAPSQETAGATEATEPEATATGSTAPEAGATEDDDAAAEAAAEAELARLAEENAAADRPSGVGQGAAAIVSVALGVVAMSGSWLGTVASARESLIGQLNTSQSASVATQVSEVYGDSWHAAAVVGGVFSLIALIVGAFVLARPAFGTPGRPQAVWIKSVAWAGVSLGVLGLLLAVAKYSDLLLGLPKTS